MPVASASFPALGSQAVLCVAEPAALAPARELLEGELRAVDLACSRFRPDSELTLLNAAGGRPVAASELLLEAVSVALRAAELTSGLVDPTVGRALRLAGYDRDFASVRRRDGRGHAVTFTAVPGWRHVEVDAARRSVRVPRGVELDLGATAKALAADRAARTIAQTTGSGALVGLGGDVAVAGRAPAGGWPIRIADDHAAGLDSLGPVVSVIAGGLATSGTAVRRWRSGSGELHHVFDPRTGGPAVTRWRTVSVAAGSCVEANVASTASIVLDDRAPAWLAERGLPARLAGTDGEVVRVGGWPGEER